MCRVAVVQPEAGAVDAEEPEGFVDDVVEESRDVAPAADLGGDPSERVGPGRTRGSVNTRPCSVARRPGRSSLGRGSLVGECHRRRKTSCGGWEQDEAVHGGTGTER